MGKGFHASDDTVGRDLAELVQSACSRVGLSVELAAIMNDSDAALLSQAYTHPGTRMGLILGTGFNMSCYLPVAALGRAKFGARSPEWFAEESQVVVNTEMSLFGGGILPLSRWDKRLLSEHPRPEFQPLEYVASGRYLGEICRHILVEAISSVGLLGGLLPDSLAQPYSLESETLSVFEE